MRVKDDSINILVASNNVFLQAGITSYVSNEDGIKIAGQPSNELELLEYVQTSHADVVILTEDEGNGFGNSETIQLINSKAKDIKILMIIKDYNADRELSGLKMGVRGFLSENAGSADFIKCVKALCRGEMWVRRSVMEKFIHQLLVIVNKLRHEHNGTAITFLTNREIEIMVMAGRGYKNREIGDKLSISQKTVKSLLFRIYKKLNVRKREEIRQYLNLAI